MTRRLVAVAAALLVPAGAMLVAWGWRSAVVYLFFLAVVSLLAVASGVGGDWLESASRGRFRSGRG